MTVEINPKEIHPQPSHLYPLDQNISALRREAVDAQSPLFHLRVVGVRGEVLLLPLPHVYQSHSLIQLSLRSILLTTTTITKSETNPTNNRCQEEGQWNGMDVMGCDGMGWEGKP